MSGFDDPRLRGGGWRGGPGVEDDRLRRAPRAPGIQSAQPLLSDAVWMLGPDRFPTARPGPSAPPAPSD